MRCTCHRVVGRRQQQQELLPVVPPHPSAFVRNCLICIQYEMGLSKQSRPHTITKLQLSAQKVFNLRRRLHAIQVGFYLRIVLFVPAKRFQEHVVTPGLKILVEIINLTRKFMKFTRLKAPV